jgi:hypothetical protein
MAMRWGNTKELREELASLPLRPVSGIKSATIRLSYDNDLRHFFSTGGPQTVSSYYTTECTNTSLQAASLLFAIPNHSFSQI